MSGPKTPAKTKPFGGLPQTISTGRALANQALAEKMGQQRRGGINFAALNKADEMPGDKPLSPAAQREAQIRQASYRVEDTTPSKLDLSKDLPGFMRLECTEIQAFDHNPRIFANESAQEIRASLLAHGIQGAFEVTRRGPGQPYMLAAGANTTLTLVQQLWAETGDERFRWVPCVFQPYQSDTRLLAQHLAENLNRGDMKFWEQAKGMLDLVQQIEKEQFAAGKRTKAMTVREIVEVLDKEHGLRTNRTNVSIWQFALARLHPLGDCTRFLKQRQVLTTLQPRLNLLALLAELLKVPADEFWNEITARVLRRIASVVEQQESPELDAVQIVDSVAAALAEHAGESVPALRSMMAGLEVNPTATLAELRAPSPNLAVGTQPSSTDPVGHEDPAPAGHVTQSALALGPTVIRNNEGSGTARTPRVSGAPGHSPLPQAAQSGESPAETGGQTVASPVSSAPATNPLQQALGLGAEASGDSLQALQAALFDLARAAGIQDTLQLHAPMPLGFYLDLPDPVLHQRATVAEGSPEHQQREIKSAVWWTLSLLSGQWCNGAEACLDHGSAFFLHYSKPDHADPFQGLDIESQEPDGSEVLLNRVRPGLMRPVMHLVRVVESLAAQVYEDHPERWRLMERLQASNSPY